MGRGRASKKKKQLIVDDDEVPSSVYAVVANDDLLIEILLRLPTCSLLLFKSVSKRWLSLITDPVSTLRCSQKRNVEPPSGFFLQLYMSYGHISNYVAFDVNRSPPLKTTTNFRVRFPNEGNVEILQSCNGLLLCRFIHSDTQYCVYNPSVNQYKILTPPFHMGGMRLAFDPTESPHYKILFAGQYYDDDHGSYYTQIHTYSSETGTWSICPDRFSDDLFYFYHFAIYWNNALHWIRGGHIHSKLDVEHLVLTTIQTPDHDELVGEYCTYELFESRGCLLFLCGYTRHLAIYEMSKGYSGWSKKYLVNFDNGIYMKLVPLSERLHPRIIKRWYDVLCIVLGEKEEDSFLVMETYGKVVQYKIMLKTVRKLYDWGTRKPEVSGHLYHGGYQYYASFASV